MRIRLSILVLSILFSYTAHSQTDSLIINGKIINLDGRLYRKSSFVTVARNNIFQPNSEIIHQAPLQADGSYRFAIPLNYVTEEFFLDYGGMANATFLGTKGEARITFNADSIGKAKRLFYFSGVLAEANNQYFSYLEAEKKAFDSNKRLGTDFFKTFWSNNQDQAQQEIVARRDFRLEILNNISKNSPLDDHLRYWITSKATDESQTIWLDYLIANRLIDRYPTINLNDLIAQPLTPDKVLLSEKFFHYAQFKLDEIKYANPGKYESLPVKTMAQLILDNNSKLTDSERLRLTQLTEEGLKDRNEINFLNQMFARNEVELNMLFDFERFNRMATQEFSDASVAFLLGKYLTKRFFTFDQKQINTFGNHIQKHVSALSLSKSLREIIDLEVKDSVLVQEFINSNASRETPTEVIPGYFLSTSTGRGSTWLKDILKYYEGNTVYIVKWNLDDPGSLSNLEYMAFLRNSLPENVVFLYIHLVDNDQNFRINDLAKQFIIRHNLRGTHMLATNNQTLDLLFKLNPLESDTYAIIGPNGKFLDKNAPAPSDTEKLIPILINASR
tara:strand:- start:448 stop:2127 length:1680 start_codon:yes stop_codon:yes gene_type:complete